MAQPGAERHQEKREGLVINEKGKKEETGDSVHRPIYNRNARRKKICTEASFQYEYSIMSELLIAFHNQTNPEYLYCCLVLSTTVCSRLYHPFKIFIRFLTIYNY